VTEDVTFYRDCRPGAVASYPPPGPITYPYPSTMYLGSEEMVRSSKRQHSPTIRAGRGSASFRQRPTSAGSSSARKNPPTERPTLAVPKTNQILRTIYLPNEESEGLRKSVANLQEQLTKQQQLHDERVQVGRSNVALLKLLGGTDWSFYCTASISWISSRRKRPSCKKRYGALKRQMRFWKSRRPRRSAYLRKPRRTISYCVTNPKNLSARPKKSS
jgi:hypothetical protein